MGRDKATILRSTEKTQAHYLAGLLTALDGMRGVELGPGASPLEAFDDPGEGPARALVYARDQGYLAARVLVVVPVDLFRLELGGLGWLVRQARQAPLVVAGPSGPSWTICGGRGEAFRWNPPGTSMRELVRGFRLLAPPLPLAHQFLDADRPEELP